MKKLILPVLVLLLSIVFVTAQPRLPVVGADNNQWGTILNDYLSQEHNGSGSHNFSINTSTLIRTGGMLDINTSYWSDLYLKLSGGTLTGAVNFSSPTIEFAGIQNHNLLDKSDTETIGGTWTHGAPLIIDIITSEAFVVRGSLYDIFDVDTSTPKITMNADVNINNNSALEINGADTISSTRRIWASDGSEGAPSHSFGAPFTDYGMWLTGAQSIAFSRDGTKIFEITATSVQPGNNSLTDLGVSDKKWNDVYITRLCNATDCYNISDFFDNTDSNLTEDDVEAFIYDSDIELLTGRWNMSPYGTGDILSDEIDFHVGNNTYGALEIGAVQLFISSLTVAGMDLNGTMIYRKPPDSGTSAIEHAFVTTANLIRFAIPTAGTDYAIYNPRSMMVGGDLGQSFDDGIINCSAQGYNIIDCDASGTGADLGVQDDAEIRGSLYVNESINASDWTNVTITESQISDLQSYVINNTGGLILNFTNIYSDDWTNITITESQINDLSHSTNYFELKNDYITNTTTSGINTTKGIFSGAVLIENTLNVTDNANFSKNITGRIIKGGDDVSSELHLYSYPTGLELQNFNYGEIVLHAPIRWEAVTSTASASVIEDIIRFAPTLIQTSGLQIKLIGFNYVPGIIYSNTLVNSDAITFSATPGITKTDTALEILNYWTQFRARPVFQIAHNKTEANGWVALTLSL